MCVFSPVLDQIDFPLTDGQSTKVWQYGLIYAIIICNFFLVSLVLINLLIAMMSATYGNINKLAISGWNHCRASIIVNLDKEMAAENKQNRYWESHEQNKYWEETEGRRYICFLSSDDRETFLAPGSICQETWLARGSICPWRARGSICQS